MLWRTRGPLYRFALAILLVILPLNLLSVLLPFWLELEAEVKVEGRTRGGRHKEHVHYGVWQLCSDSQGCSWVHGVHVDTGVGGGWVGWFVSFFLSFLRRLILSPANRTGSPQLCTIVRRTLSL